MGAIYHQKPNQHQARANRKSAGERYRRSSVRRRSVTAASRRSMDRNGDRRTLASAPPRRKLFDGQPLRFARHTIWSASRESWLLLAETVDAPDYEVPSVGRVDRKRVGVPREFRGGWTRISQDTL